MSQRLGSLSRSLALLFVAGACGGANAPTAPLRSTPTDESVRGASRTSERTPRSAGAATRASNAPSRLEMQALALFEARVKAHGDMTYGDLARELSLDNASDPPLPFDPTQFAYFDKISGDLGLS